MARGILPYFRIWGNLLIFLITVYEFVLPRIPLVFREKYHLESLGWSWQIWLIIFLASIIITLMLERLFEKDRNKDAEIFPVKAVARNDSQALAIQYNYGNVYIQKGKKQRKRKKAQPNLSKTIRETYPNIDVIKFDSEVLTLKLVTKMNGQTVQVGQGETLERFYIEFVNRKRENIKTEDAISVYVTVSFYTKLFKLIKTHDKPRWWTIYDPFDEKTWEAKINLEANGKPQRLFLVLRKKNESQYYIFSRESHNVANWIIPELELKNKINYICIRLSANNYDAKDIWVRMKKNGNKKPSFELLPSDPRKEAST